MRKAIWFVGYAMGIATGAAGIAAADPGDLIQSVSQPEVSITAAQAVCFADCAIAAGAWTGERSAMDSASCHRTPLGFRASAQGTKIVKVADIPAGGGEVRIVGRVE